MSVMVQKMMETAPNTSDAVGSDEKTLGKVYRGEVPAWKCETGATQHASALHKLG